MTEGPPIGLPMAVSAAVDEFITGPVLARPYAVGKPLTNKPAGCHPARRGAYLVVNCIDDKTHTVPIVRIDHCADVYHP